MFHSTEAEYTFFSKCIMRKKTENFTNKWELKHHVTVPTNESKVNSKILLRQMKMEIPYTDLWKTLKVVLRREGGNGCPQ